jgi:hypothetical protein
MIKKLRKKNPVLGIPSVIYFLPFDGTPNLKPGIPKLKPTPL